MTNQELKIEWVAIDRVFCNPANPRDNDKAVPHVAASLRRFGWRQPIVARPDGQIVAGNTRHKAAQLLEWTEVPVVRFEGTDADAVAYSIADNRTHEFADWDEPALAQLLGHLRTEDALDGVGFSEQEIDSLLAELDQAQTASVEDPGPEPPAAEAVSQLGDLWLMGRHRLLCGDSTNKDDFARLMGDDMAVLLATDPPYCVGYTGAERPENSGKDWSGLYREIDIADLETFLRDVFQAILPHVTPACAIYVWHAHVQYPVLDRVFENFDIIRHQPIVWAKPASTFTYCFYRWAHETCLFGWRRGHKPPHYLPNGLDTVWSVDWDGKQRLVGNEHPTQKPVRLFEIPMEQHTKPGAIVLEPFSGSGSQLIAAERLGRVCRAVEVQPCFVDVAVRRWQEATGQPARLEGADQTFDDVAAERGAGQPQGRLFG